MRINAEREQESTTATASATTPSAPVPPPATNPPAPKPITPKNATGTPIYTDSAVLALGGHIYTDYDTRDIYEKRSDREFYVHQPLSAEVLGNGDVLIKNVLPYEFKNVTIYLQPKGASWMHTPTKAIILEKMPRYFVCKIPYPFNNETKTERQVEDDKNQTVTIKKTDLDKNGGMEMFAWVENDALFTKIQKIRCTTKVTWLDFTKHPKTANPQNWLPTEARDIIAYTPLIINMAYLYSSNQFRTEFMNYPYPLLENKVFPGYYPGTNDDQPEINRAATYSKMLTIPTIAYGVAGGAEGLGGLLEPGIHSFGMHRRYVRDNTNYANNGSLSDFWAHEYGHVLGFVHSSNMTYPQMINGNRSGYTLIVQKIYGEMQASGELPFSTYPLLPSDHTATPVWK